MEDFGHLFPQLASVVAAFPFLGLPAPSGQLLLSPGIGHITLWNIFLCELPTELDCRFHEVRV